MSVRPIWQLLGMVLLLFGLTLHPRAAFAQQEALPSRQSGAHLDPFPPGDTYRLQVIGDWMAENMNYSVVQAFERERQITVAPRFRSLSSLVNVDPDTLLANDLATASIQIAVVMLGINDRRHIRSTVDGRLIRLRTEAWKVEYGRRVDMLLKALRQRGAAIYLIGQPPLAREPAHGDAQLINEIMRDKAFVNGARFIDLMTVLEDDNGEYMQYGPDHLGNRVKLRENDGISLTWQGYRMVAALVETEIRRDLAIALAERDVPLAGSEVEQRRISPNRAAASARSAGTNAGTNAGTGTSITGNMPSSPAPPSTASTGPATAPVYKAETTRRTLRLPLPDGKVETITVELPRPAVSVAALQALKRKETAAPLQPQFDTIAAELTDGSTLSLVVTALPATGSVGGPAAAVSAYQSVWIRGEQLPPRAGRADDFRWPLMDEPPLGAVDGQEGQQTPGRRADAAEPAQSALSGRPADRNTE